MANDETTLRASTAESPSNPRDPRTKPVDATAVPTQQVRTDVQELLAAYHGSLALARNPPPSISLPPRARRTRRLHLRLRGTWGAHQWTAHHIRRNVDALERGFARRLALGTADGNDQRAHQSLCQFKDSLPPPTSRLLPLGLFIAALVIAQKMLDGLPGLLKESPAAPAAGQALRALGPSPSVASTRDLLNAVVHSSAFELLTFIAAISWSAYLVMRPLAAGYRLAGLALGRRDGLGVPRRHAELIITARRLATHSKERAILARFGSPRPPEFPFDLVVKAALCVPPLVFGGLLLRIAGQPDVILIASFLELAIPALALIRVTMLGLASHKRGTGNGWVLLLVPFLPLACLGPALYVDSSPRQLASDQPRLRLMLSMQHDLRGVDLRYRNLTGFYFYGKDLAYADLSNANLTDANLTQAKLFHARLRDATLFGAILKSGDLRRADLTRADLTTGDLTGARLSYARLRDATLPPFLRRANLRHADLTRADLTYDYLTDADLRHANFTHANLTGAHLYGADLRHADLTRADLTDANLIGVDLRHANFTHADLTRARLYGADLRGTDLRKAVSFDTTIRTTARYDRTTRWPPHLALHTTSAPHP